MHIVHLNLDKPKKKKSEEKIEFESLIEELERDWLILFHSVIIQNSDPISKVKY